MECVDSNPAVLRDVVGVAEAQEQRAPGKFADGANLSLDELFSRSPLLVNVPQSPKPVETVARIVDAEMVSGSYALAEKEEIRFYPANSARPLFPE